MSQNAAIFAALLIAFVVFITMRNELGTYIGFFLGGGSTPPPQPSGSSMAGNASGAATGGGSGNLMGTATTLAPLALAFL